MAYSVVPSVITGDSWTAGNQNTYVRDNFKASYPDVYTAAGQINYGTGSHLGDLLPIGTAFQTLKVNSGGTYPEWQTRNNEGILMRFGACTSVEKSWCRVYWLVGDPFYNRGDFVYTSSDDAIYIPKDGIYQISGFVNFGNGVVAYGSDVAVRIGPDNTEVLRGNCNYNGQYIWSFCETKRLAQNDAVYMDIYNPTYAASFSLGTEPRSRLSIIYLGAST